MRVGVACGGTGGHVLPGLVVAGALKARGHDVTLWLAGKTIESEIARGWDGSLEMVPAAGFQETSLLSGARAALSLFRSFCECRRRMKVHPPDVLLAMGSYASVGPALAARSLRVPLALHESNAIPGRAVAMLGPLAEAVAVSFQTAAPRLKGLRVEHTGFPVRPQIEKLAGAGRSWAGDFTVLVMGGSQGARILNETAPRAMALARVSAANLRVVHLAGSAWADRTRDVYSGLGIPAEVHGFFQDMALLYGRASLAVARAGAATCSELAIAGLPALFVPLPWAARDHQTANARAMAEGGAADMMPQALLTEERLAEYVVNVYKNPAKLEKMSAAMRRLAVPGAAQKIAELVERIGGG